MTKDQAKPCGHRSRVPVFCIRSRVAASVVHGGHQVRGCGGAGLRRRVDAGGGHVRRERDGRREQSVGRRIAGPRPCETLVA
eukprot:1873456-Prymnesium_polylepis.1